MTGEWTDWERSGRMVGTATAPPKERNVGLQGLTPPSGDVLREQLLSIPVVNVRGLAIQHLYSFPNTSLLQLSAGEGRRQLFMLWLQHLLFDDHIFSARVRFRDWLIVFD